MRLAAILERMRGSRLGGPWSHVAVGVALLGIVFAEAHPALNLRPFDLDNLTATTLAETGSIGDAFTSTVVAGWPGYRPLMIVALKAEDALLGVGAWHFVAVNLVLVALCALAVYALTLRVTSSRPAALLVGLLFAVDPRLDAAFGWEIERQSTLALLCGALALLVALRRDDAPLSRRRLAAVGVLLLAAALFKEYGMAAVAAVAVAGLVGGRRERPLVLVAVAVVAVYAAIRVGLAGGTTTAFCETMGIRDLTRQVCLGTTRAGFYPLHGWASWAQVLWNVGATGLGTPLPVLFSDVGAWAPWGDFAGNGSASILADALFVAIAIAMLVGIASDWRRAAPFVTLIVVNALLSFLLFRGRNQVLGMLGLYVIVGLGLARLWDEARPRLRPSHAAAVAALVVVVLGGWTAQRIDRENGRLHDYVRGIIPASTEDLCAKAFYGDPSTLDSSKPYIAPQAITALKHYYGYSDPDCAAYRRTTGQ